MGDQEETRDWLAPPTTRDAPPSSEGTLFAAVLALGDSTDRVGSEVEGLRTQRKGLIALLLITCVLVIVFTVVNSVGLSRIANTDRIATGLTSQQAQRDQIARADFRTDRTIFCINSFAASLENPARPYDARCPQAYPGLPVTSSPSMGQ